MATYYWVGGAGTWNNTSTLKWSSSSGGPTGAGPPTANDDVIFDVASDSGSNFNVTVSTGATCRDITIKDDIDKVITIQSGTITIAGSLKSSATANCNITSSLRFTATTTGKTIDLEGDTVGNITFDGAGGEWTLLDNLPANATTGVISILAGTLKCSTFNMSAANITSTGTGTRTIELGTGTTHTISGVNGTWEVSGSGYTITEGTSLIKFTGGGSNVFTGGSDTYYNLEENASATNTSLTINGDNTFNNLTVAAVATTGVTTLFLAGNQTINGTLTIGGASAIRRMKIETTNATFGTTRTLTCAAIATCADADFYRITIAGAAAPLSGTRLGNAGGNSGITFDAGAPKYWNLTGSQNITATGWATSDGGTPAANNFPLAQDTMYFTNTGAMSTVTVTDNWWFGSIDMSARTNAATFTVTNAIPRIWGSLTVGTGITWNGTGASMEFRALGGTTNVLDTNGVTLASRFQIRNEDTGTLQLSENAAFSLSGTGLFAQGILDLNGKTLTFGCNISSNTTTTREIKFGANGLLIAKAPGTGAFTAFNTWDMTNFTISGSKNIEFSPTSTGATTATFTNQGTDAAKSFNVLVSSGTNDYSLSGSFDDISTQGYTGTDNIFAGVTGITVYGNLTIGTGHAPTAALAAANALTYTVLTGQTKQLRSNGQTINLDLVKNGPGKLELYDAYTGGATNSELRISAGTFDTKNFNVACGNLRFDGSTTRQLDLGTSTITLSAASGTILDGSTSTGLTLNATTSTIILAPTSTTAVTFSATGLTFGTVTVGGSTNAEIVLSGSHSFKTFSSTRTVAWTLRLSVASSTQNFENFTVAGSSGNVVTITRTTGTVTMNYNGTTRVCTDWLAVGTGINATPATLTWYIGANSTAVGTGWILEACPATATGNFFMCFR